MADVADHQFDIGPAGNHNSLVVIVDITVNYARVYASLARIPGIYGVICSDWNRRSCSNAVCGGLPGWLYALDPPE